MLIVSAWLRNAAIWYPETAEKSSQQTLRAIREKVA
jgi:hypothetical protein